MIHCYKLGGLNIVLDICSGSVHLVDQVSYDVIELYESHSHEEIIKIITEKYPETTEAELREGFEQIEAEDLQVFADIITDQDLLMIPLSELPQSWDQTVIFNTPPQNL